MTKHPKRPRDPSQLGKFIVGVATGEIKEAVQPDTRDPAAVALGAKGGRARAARLSPQERRAIARKGGAALWASKKGKKGP